MTKVVEDSSGNAAASLAAYCASAGIEARIFVPAHASGAKIDQITAYGAEVVVVPGSRSDVAHAAQVAAVGTYYASHNYSPFFLEGTKTFAYEVWEQLGGRPLDNLVLPVGNGSLLVGAYRGFYDLNRAGVIDRMPRLFAVQSEACPPLVEGYRRGLNEPPLIRDGETIAEGIRIARPVRGGEILRAIRETGGAAVAVDDAEILEAKVRLARKGLYVEPTSAVALAGLRRLGRKIHPAEITVLALTGNGLKVT